MSDLIEFKRLNFFTGFFTAADDWNQGQEYHLAKRRLHNRGLHTPGIIQGVRESLEVRAAQGLNVLILPGAAIDADGNDIYLGESHTLTINPEDNNDFPQLVYIAIRYRESMSDYVEDVEAPAYSGYTRVTEIPQIEVTITRPDNSTSLELARIALTEDVTEIADPAYPDNPDNNEIDRRHVVWAGSVVPAKEPEPLPDFDNLIQVMDRTRSDFAALSARFPVPSAIDVRQTAITIELLVHAGSLRLDHIPGVFRVLADIEKDVEQEVGNTYPALITSTEFQAYQRAVTALLTALDENRDYTILYTRQDEVAEAVRELSEVALQPPVPPVANAGPDRTIPAAGIETSVILDASSSEAFGGRKIVHYHWSMAESQVPAPVADAGPDRIIAATGEETTATLDASGSRAFGERTVVRYQWDRM